MNKKLKEILSNIFAYFVIGYIFISWIFAILLLIYNFILVPIAKANIPIDISLMQQLNSLNISSFGNNLNQTIQVLQSYTPIPTNQLIEDELILILPPAILLGLIYHEAKKENDDK
jgi:hypothetical protein